jgi:hypothetical protein
MIPPTFKRRTRPPDPMSKPPIQGRYSTCDLEKFILVVWYCGKNNIPLIRNWDDQYCHNFGGGPIISYDLSMRFKSQKQFQCFQKRFG